MNTTLLKGALWNGGMWEAGNFVCGLHFKTNDSETKRM